jgi:type II secretory pathway pseudopilin PulG
MKAKPAFTLIELIMALVMSSFVIVGIIGVTSQMARYRMEGGAKSTNTGFTVMSLDRMEKDLQGASVLYCPYSTLENHSGWDSSGNCTQSQSNALSGCSNYSLATLPTGFISGSPTSFYYCIWCGGSPCATPTQTPWLLHYSGSGSCPISPVPTCGSGSYDVVAQNVYPIGANTYYFKRDDAINGVDLMFQIGMSTGTGTGQDSILTTNAIQTVNTKISMQKAYGTTTD